MADILVLGRMFPEQTEREVVRKSRGMVSTAAHAHLSKIIEGLDQNLDKPVKVMNIMPVSSYPKRYDDLWIPEFSYAHTENAQDINIGFCNLTVWKKLSMRRALKKHVLRWARDGKKNKAVIVYTCCTMFLKACQWIKQAVPDCRICIIVPDLPAYTNLDKANRPLYSLLTRWQARRANALIGTADCFVFLTEQMKEAFTVKRPYIVMEAIADNDETTESKTNDDLRYIVYTGTFTKKYGVMDLVRAFGYITDENYRLVLCGSGEAEEEINAAAQQDKRILYRGMVTREEARKIQRGADIMVNPRQNDHVFTRYSFPSKLMEYLSAGRPVLCFRLDGIPKEYDRYLTYFSSAEPQRMAEEIMRLCEKNKDTLSAIGEEGRAFVLREKNSAVQAKRILDMLFAKRLLFVGNTLDIGGTTTSLLSLLKALEGASYQIDLILSRNKGEGLNSLPDFVHLLKPALRERFTLIDKAKKFVLYLCKGYLYEAYRYQRTGGRPLGLFQILSGKARSEAGRSLDKRYDTAIGYMEGFADWYTAKKVHADRKIAYIHVNYEQAGLDPKLDCGLWEQFSDIVFVSEDSRQSFVRCFPQLSQKTCVVENLLSKALIMQRAEASVQDDILQNGYFHLITAARLVNRHKAIDRAVRIAGRLVHDGYPIRWHVFGEGEDRAELEALIRQMRLEGIVFLHGNRENIYPYIKKADLFVMVSHYEGKPMAVSEAMLLGTPVLVTEYASAREQVEDGETGFICENDEDSVYEKIKMILTCPEMLENVRKNLEGFQQCGDVRQFYALMERGKTVGDDYGAGTAKTK